MTRREKQRDLFIELINYQLKEHGVTYDEVKENPAWYMQYKTTPEKENEFQEHCVNRISNVLKLNRKQAELEASWFILQWGLTSSYPQDSKTPELQNKKAQRTPDSSDIL